MPKFSEESERLLSMAHNDLQKVAFRAIDFIDFKVISSYRPPEEQNSLFKQGRRLVDGVYVVSDINDVITYKDGYFRPSKHNTRPSSAIDLAPYPIDWNNKSRFYYMAGMILMLSLDLFKKGEIKKGIRWGGDFNQNGNLTDDGFIDLPHFEIVEPKILNWSIS